MHRLLDSINSALIPCRTWVSKLVQLTNIVKNIDDFRDKFDRQHENNGYTFENIGQDFENQFCVR